MREITAQEGDGEVKPGDATLTENGFLLLSAWNASWSEKERLGWEEVLVVSEVEPEPVSELLPVVEKVPEEDCELPRGAGSTACTEGVDWREAELLSLGSAAEVAGRLAPGT